MSRGKIVDQSKICSDIEALVKQNRKSGKRTGIFNKPIDEPIPTYEKAQVENIITGQNNSFIILGRDRPGTLKTGFGAKGATQSARIDLIAGLGSGFQNKDATFGPPCENTIINPNFALDGARIYMSQRADIDKYMGLMNTPRDSQPGSSAIGLKADAIRIHARQDVKIVSGRMRVEGVGRDGERLAHGGKNEVVGTISLIAGNYTNPHAQGPALQPMVKGDNLSQCIEEMFSIISELYAMIKANGDHISQLNTSTGAHIHTLAAPAPIPTIPSPTQLPFAGVLSVLDMVERASAEVMSRRIQSVAQRYIKLNDTDPEPYRNIRSKHVFTT